MPGDSFSGVGSLPGFQMDAFSLYPLTAETESSDVSSSFKGTNPVMGFSYPMTSCKHNYLLNASSPNVITLGINIWICGTKTLGP